MCAAVVKESPGLLGLSVDIVNRILCSIDSPDTLANTVVSCRSLYNLFKENQDVITRQVVINCIGTQVLPEAAVLYKCRPPYYRRHENQPWRLEERKESELVEYTVDFVNNLQRPTLPSLRFSLDDALALERTHSSITTLRDRCIKSCADLKVTMSLKGSLLTLPPSPAETARIDRALYRFDLFRKLFNYLHGRWGYFPAGGMDNKVVHDFFINFSAWENTQLGCIHDLLVSQIMSGMLVTPQNAFGLFGDRTGH